MIWVILADSLNFQLFSCIISKCSDSIEFLYSMWWLDEVTFRRTEHGHVPIISVLYHLRWLLKGCLWVTSTVPIWALIYAVPSRWIVLTPPPPGLQILFHPSRWQLRYYCHWEAFSDLPKEREWLFVLLPKLLYLCLCSTRACWVWLADHVLLFPTSRLWAAWAQGPWDVPYAFLLSCSSVEVLGF